MDLREECIGCGKHRILNEENFCADCWNKKVRKENEQERLRDEEEESPEFGIHEYDPESDEDTASENFEKFQNRLDDSDEFDDDTEDK